MTDEWVGPADMLAAGLDALGIELTASQQAQLLEFVAILGRWNRTYNLTRITDPAEMVRLHLLDSLSLLPHLNGSRVLDVGTGAGLPGLPLAIAAPERAFVLLDSVAKKIRFCRHVITSLGLKNASAVHGRVERLGDSDGFTTVTARAVGSATQLVQWSEHLLHRDGQWLLMKGRYPAQELEELESMGENVRSISIELPGGPAGDGSRERDSGQIVRHLVRICRGAPERE